MNSQSELQLRGIHFLRAVQRHVQVEGSLATHRLDKCSPINTHFILLIERVKGKGKTEGKK